MLPLRRPPRPPMDCSWHGVRGKVWCERRKVAAMGGVMQGGDGLTRLWGRSRQLRGRLSQRPWGSLGSRGWRRALAAARAAAERRGEVAAVTFPVPAPPPRLPLRPPPRARRGMAVSGWGSAAGREAVVRDGCEQEAARERPRWRSGWVFVPWHASGGVVGGGGGGGGRRYTIRSQCRRACSLPFVSRGRRGRGCDPGTTREPPRPWPSLLPCLAARSLDVPGQPRALSLAKTTGH